MEELEKKCRFDILVSWETLITIYHREFLNDSFNQTGDSEEFLAYMLFRIKESKDKLR